VNLVIDARESQLARVGVAVYAANVIPRLIELSKEKHNVTLLISKNAALPFEAYPAKTLAIAPSPTDSIFSKLRWYFFLPALLDELNADVYFGSVTRLPFMRRFRCELVITVHDAASISTKNVVDNGLQRLVKNYFLTKAVNSAARIVCISKYCRDEFTRIFGNAFNEKAVVIHHGLPNEFVIEARDANRGSTLLSQLRHGRKIRTRYLLTVGTITPKKNYIRLMNAFDNLEDQDTSLIIVGKESYGSEEIIRHRTSLKAPGRIYFIGALSTAELCFLMERAECFVFPSLYEGFGLPLLEAFHVGTPVLCSNATCLPEIAGDAAIYFDPLDIRDMTEKMDLILRQDFSAGRADLVLKGKARLDHFSWKSSAAEHFKVIESLDPTLRNR
jgi:glycosyltransferase involved in cell wall biosynthesis